MQSGTPNRTVLIVLQDAPLDGKWGQSETRSVYSVSVKPQIAALRGYLRDKGHYVEVFESVDNLHDNIDRVVDKFANTPLAVVYDSDMDYIWGHDLLWKLPRLVDKDQRVPINIQGDIASWWDNVRSVITS